MNRSWLAAVFLICALPVAAKTTAGDAALAQFDLPGATRAYRTALSEKPYDYEATWKLTRALLDQATLTKDLGAQKSLIVEAEVFARRAIQSNPTDSKGHLYLAVAVGKLALFEGGKRKVELSKEIKTAAEKAIALNPQEDTAYHVLAIWHREMATLNFVLKKFAEILYGEFPPAKLTDAEANLRKAVELAPATLAHQVELGITLRVAGKHTEAKTVLEAALKLPKAWVTDDHYKTLATNNLARLKK